MPTENVTSNELKDIGNIPYFAYSPGIYAWLILIGAAVLSVIIFRLTISRKNAGYFRAFEKSLNDIKKLELSITANSNLKDIIFSASMIVRRLVSHLESEDISSLSAKELREKEQSAGSALKILLSAIIKIEDSKYMPGLNIDKTKELLSNLILSLNDYKTERDLLSEKK
jgi:hypothetical protein